MAAQLHQNVVISSPADMRDKQHWLCFVWKS